MREIVQARKLEQEIQKLSQDIFKLEGLRRELDSRIGALNSRFGQTRIGHARNLTFRFLKRFREPSRDLIVLWPVALMLIGPMATFGLVLVLVHLTTREIENAVDLAIGASLVVASGLACLLFFPSNTVISKVLERDRIDKDKLDYLEPPIRAEWERMSDELDALRQKKASLEKDAVLVRGRFLDSNWKELKAIEWETFLEKVFRANGAGVQRTKASGDQGVDLIVIFGTRRIAIQAKGYSGAVGNKAVQEVVSGQRFYDCDACAVITNSRFTKQAHSLARANNCLLIDQENFAAFVFGKIQLLAPVSPARESDSC